MTMSLLPSEAIEYVTGVTVAKTPKVKAGSFSFTDGKEVLPVMCDTVENEKETN